MAEFKSPQRLAPRDYRWDKDAQFILSGEEFDFIQRALRASLNDPDFMRAVYIYEGLKVADKIIREGIEAGVVKEVERVTQTTVTDGTTITQEVEKGE